MEVAGSVEIQIGGNIAPFERALAKAQQIATTFDAQISAKLSGAGISEGLAKIAAGVDQTNALLTKLSGSSGQATAALGKVTTSSQQASAAINQAGAAAATASSEISRIGQASATSGLGAATVSAKTFAAALEAAGGDLTKVNVALEEQASEVKAVTDALRGYSQAQVDAMRSQQAGANFNQDLQQRVGILDQATKSARDSAAAFQAFGLTETEVALGASNVANEIGHGATAARLGAAQMASLGHSARSAVESLALGVSPLQALTMQANHLSFALSGPQGVIAATAGARAALMGWLASAPGILTTAGVAAVAGVAAYVIEARNDIKSVDEVLSEHKALIDEIAGAYPEAAKQAASYAEAAKRIPQSVATADIVDQAKENKKTLDDTLGFLSTRLEGLSQEWGLVGSAGTKAFGDLAQIAKSGASDAADQLEAALGRLRIDPTLNDNAREFAKQLQADATAAAKLQDALNEKNAIKDIVADGKKASQSLYDVSKGFKDVGSSAGGADATIAKLFGTLNSAGSERFGVTRSAGALAGFAGDAQTTLGAFQKVDDAVQQARQSQLQSYMEIGDQLRSTTQDLDAMKQAIASAAGKDNIDAFFGDVSGIKGAQEAISDATSTVKKLFDALRTGNASVSGVYQSLDMVRQSLIGAGLGADQVNKFVDSLVKAYMQMNADSGAARQLNSAIQAIRNRTVTITVVTRRVGTGTQSLYDVPNSSGGTSGIGVTRYGGDGSSSGPSMSSYSVPTEGGSYGSQGGSGGSGNNTVNVTRFATGGMIHPGDTQQVSFFKSPDETVGIFTPGQMQALADPQSGFTGTQPTANDNRAWTVLMNVEANTKKTAQLLDDIKTATASASSALGGSSYGGSSSRVDTSQQAHLSAQYAQVLAQIRSNFAAAGIVGRGIIGYGLDNLAASPEQIARNIVYGGSSPVGFDKGGMIAPGDTQQVKFFKSPEETVAIFTPQQVQALQGANQNGQATSTDQRPIQFNQTNHWSGDAPPSQDSLAAVRRATALGFLDAQRAARGR